MIEKLRKKFPNARNHLESEHLSDELAYFKDDKGSIYSIPKKDLTEDELKLLNILFPIEQFVSAKPPINSIKEQWMRFLTSSDETVLPLTSWEEIRFISFTVLNNVFSQQDAEEALLTLFSIDSVIIWMQGKEGFVIEPKSLDSMKKNELEPVMDAMESDFNVRFRLFIGSFHSVNQQLSKQYRIERKFFEIGEQYLPAKKLQNLSSLFPFLLVNGYVKQHKDWFLQYLLGETAEDRELITTIKTYIECNSNASLTAKKLYIHRNSLQYRIDKFIEKTGMDIRTFEDAVAVYLMIVTLS